MLNQLWKSDESERQSDHKWNSDSLLLFKEDLEKKEEN